MSKSYTKEQRKLAATKRKARQWGRNVKRQSNDE